MTTHDKKFDAKLIADLANESFSNLRGKNVAISDAAYMYAVSLKAMATICDFNVVKLPCGTVITIEQGDQGEEEKFAS